MPDDKPEGIGYRAQAFGGLLSVPIVAFIIALVLFGPTILISFMKVLPGIPLHIWIVGIVLLFVWKWLK